MASIPTASPQPTATAMVLPPTPTSITFPTPLPTATPVTFPPTATPQPTPTPQPTATPRALPPTPTPRPTPTTVPSGTTSGSTGNGAISVEPGNPALTIEPTLPVAGRDINFTMTGLPPWQQVSVGFIDPLGEPAEWIDKNEFLYTWTDGQPVVDRTLFADGSGEVSWLRIGTNDVDGVWSVRLEAGDQSSLSNYALTQIQLPEQPTETIGIQMRHYRGSLSDTYYSALVPSSVAVDLQAHLGWVIKQLSEVQGIQSLQIPDIYLAGNENLFSELAAATGTFVGFEDGFYRRSGNRPGIYIRTDTFRADLQALLTHEYVHLVLDEIASGRSLASTACGRTQSSWEEGSSWRAARGEAERPLPAWSPVKRIKRTKEEAEMSSEGRIRVMVVDDHPVMRNGLRDTLEASGRFEAVEELLRDGRVVRREGTVDLEPRTARGLGSDRN